MTDNRNATSSWSGYLHQGKVGIFVALEKIIELLSNGASEYSLNNWRVIYENAEDFDIQEKDENGSIDDNGENWRVEDRHQVKAKKSSTSFSDYCKVLGVQHYEVVEEDVDGEKKSKLKLVTEGFQIRTFKDTGVIGDEEVEENSRYLHTIVPIPSFKGKNENLENEPDLNHYKNNPNNVQLYEYCFTSGNQKYCELPDEDNDNDKLTDESINLINIIRYKINKSTLEDKNVYYSILYYLDNNIRIEHKNDPIGYPMLTLFEILELIKNYDSFQDLEEFRLRNTFTKYCIQYKDENNLSKKDKLDKLVNNIYKLDYDKFKQFLIDVHPDKKSILNSNNDSNLNTDGLLDVFFEGLKKIRIDYLEDKIGYLFNNENYLLTAITRDNDIITKYIIENGKITHELFEGSYIINKHLEGELLKKISKVDKGKYENINWDNVDYIDKKVDYFLDPRKLEFIKIDDTITKLNNND